MANQIGGSIVWLLDVDETKFQAGLSRAKAAASGLGDDLDRKFTGIGKSISNSFREATQASQMFATGLLAVGGALTVAAGFGIKYAADLETMRQGFVTLLGSTKKADEAISQIQKDAARTPFEFKGLVQANQLLTQVTKDAPRSEALLLNIGKALAAAGKGGEELDRVIINLQQIANTGKITELDIRQFGFAGINILELLASYYGTTKEAAGEMVKDSKDAFADLEGAFQKASTGGGQFAKAFENQAGTLNQVWSNFKDNLGITASALVTQTGLFDAAKDALKRLTDALSYFASPAGIQQIIGFFDIIKANAPIIIGLIIGGLVPAFVALAGLIYTTFAPLIPFIAIGAALGAVVQLLVSAFGGWGNVLIVVRAGLQALAQIYNSFLKPSVDALINQVMNELVPTLKELWATIGPLLIPILKLFGAVLLAQVVVALRIVIDWLYYFTTVMTIFANIINNVISFVVSLFVGFKNIVAGDVIPNMVTAILTWVQNLKNGFINGIKSMVDNVISQIVGLWNAIVAEVSSWPKRMFDYGVNLIKAFADGIKSAVGAVTGAIGDVLNKAKSLLQGHSPPIEGPFKNIDAWGFNVGMAWVDGVREAINGIQIDSPLNDTGSTSTDSPVSTGQGSRNIERLVNIEHMEIRDDSDINEVSRELAFRIETSSGFVNNG